MWLIDVSQGVERPVLKNVWDTDLDYNPELSGPRFSYAILSHRWEVDNDEEITFQEMQSGDFSRAKKGWYKIEKTLQQAAIDGCDFVWIDTCCINKQSSAELQEAINSMFRWYRRAAVCYAYLNDASAPNFETMFAKSKWMTRGWTLQELVAPATVQFYDANWNNLGDKRSLSSEISAITGIGRDILEQSKRIEDCSIAQRMSWASRRFTTRVEDRAYCLIGIFGVNMPMLYGEGDQAFYRLQKEIISSSDDHSIFAWTGVLPNYPGLLARNPYNFVDSGDVESVYVRTGRHPYTMTNRGLSMTGKLIPWVTDTYLLVLNCTRAEKKGRLIGVFLRRTNDDEQYARVLVNGSHFFEDGDIASLPAQSLSRLVSFYVAQQYTTFDSHSLIGKDRIYGFRLNSELLEVDSKGKELFELKGRFDRAESLVMIANGSKNVEVIGLVDITKQRRKVEMVKFGFDKDYNPVVFLAESSAIEAKLHMVNKDGAINWHDWQYNNPEDISRDKSFVDRKPDDELGWNTVRRLKDGRLQATINKRRSGLWALKGDRLSGLDVWLENFDRPTPPAGHVQLTRKVIGDHLDGHLVWDLTVEGLLSTTTGKMANMFRREKN